jgi:predicted PurR-regulated permease PerM
MLHIADKRKFSRYAATIIILLALALLFISVRSIIAPFIFGAILAYLINPWVNKMADLRISLTASVIVIYVYIIVCLYLIVFLSLPMIKEQLSNLFLYMADLLDGLGNWGDEFFASLSSNSVAVNLQNILADAAGGIRQRLLGDGEQMVEKVMSLPRLALFFILSPLLSFYLLRDKQQISKSMINLISPDKQPELLRVSGEINKLVREFISGYLLISLIITAISTVVYYLIGLDYPLVLGILMGIGDLIPYIGPLIGAIPALLISLGMGQTTFVITLVAILIIQQVEGSIITPRIIDNKLGLNPVVTIFVVMAGGVLWGISGAILAMPLTAIIILLCQYLFTLLFRNNDLRKSS